MFHISNTLGKIPKTFFFSSHCLAFQLGKAYLNLTGFVLPERRQNVVPSESVVYVQLS